jgi:hypothetical protein
VTLLETAAHCLWRNARAARFAAATGDRLAAVATLCDIAALSPHPRLRALADGVLVALEMRPVRPAANQETSR